MSDTKDLRAAELQQQLERLVKAGQAMRDAVERMIAHQGIALGYTVEGQQCIEWDAALADVEARIAGLQRHPGA